LIEVATKFLFRKLRMARRNQRQLHFDFFYYQNKSAPLSAK